MGLKYSINSAGRIVAERDIYSLGGFIPKGELGGFIADETQLSQDGECWLSSGDISSRPDVRIKDNAYVGLFTSGINPVHTDGVTEFSGNTLIPGNISVRSFVTDTKNNVFIKDSFIGVSMDILCGPRTTTTAFPFEQGGYVPTAPRGTAFSSVVMQTGDVNICRSTDSVIRCGLNTYVYLPTGYSGRILWAYTQGETAVYSGESKVISSGLTKIEHPVYKRFMLHITKVNGTAMTPTDLLATGAKILGHISGSVLTDIRPESVSGDYVMVNSSFIAETDNFGLNATQLRFLAGSMYDTTMYTKTDRQDYKPYGTFHNVERLEYTKYLRDSHRTAANRDTYISAYDCPLLRVDDTTYDDALAAKGDLILRNCIVPKAEFQDDVINGNTYEDIDFSYANEDLGFTIAGYARFISSHKQGIYRLPNGPTALGFVSHKGNLADTAILYQAEKYIPLDGSIMEQGAYAAGANIGVPYEETKVTSNAIVRSYKPVSTASLSLPTLPSGYVLDAIVYLDESFIIRRAVANPASIETTYQYAVMQFRRADTSRLNASDFIALNCTLRIIDHTKAPEVTGSAYVGAGCTVRGDVQLHGDPYVNRVFDVNMWERGTGDSVTGETWDGLKRPESVGYPRLRTRDVFPVDTTVDNNFTCASGYNILIYYFGEDGKCSGWSPWGTSLKVSDPAVAYISILVSKTNGIDFIEDSDIPLANVKYVRAFKKRRYIVNELDRTSPEDILLSVDYWEQGTAGGGQADAGKIYEELKATSGTTIRLKRPINVSPTSSISSASGFSRYIRVLDAVTKFHLGESLASAKMALLAVIIQKDPSAAIAPSEIPNSRLVLEFVPQPRIIVPYGSSNLLIKGHKIRMYDNAVLSRNFIHDADIVLQGDAVMGYDFSSGDCLCSNGHDDAIIKLP
jgi:hypothetical protein